MTVCDVYKEIHEDYAEVFSRIDNDEWIGKYLKKFVTADYMEELENSVRDQDWARVFRNAHSMKGMTMNLGLGELQTVSSELCELVRYGAPSHNVTDLTERIRTEFDKVREAVLKLD